DRLPESCRPSSDEDALAIQQRVMELLGEKVGGWKCSLPRGEHVFLAPLPGSTIHTGPRCRFFPYDQTARIEPEVAFIIGADLLPRVTAYTEDEIRAAIGEARLVLEILGARYVDPLALPAAEFLADSIYNQ